MKECCSIEHATTDKNQPSSSRQLRDTTDYTDFPLDEITLYFTNNVMYLPSEH
jgi:hypothetical protein